MDNERFDLVFTGELVPGADLAQVKQNLSRLFKMELARVELLFSGKPVILKKGLDLDSAGKYRVAMKKAGARINTVPNRQVVPKAASGAASAAEAPAASRQQKSESQAAAPSAVAPTGGSRREDSNPDASTPDAAKRGLGLAPMAGDLLKPEERSYPPHVHVETAHLSLREVGGELVDEHEREIHVPLPVNLQEWEVAPAGADVLKAEERSRPPTVAVDISGLSLAEPGARLEAPKPAPPAPPDTSQLSLADPDRPQPGGSKQR